MKQYQRKIEEYKALIQKKYVRETAVHAVMEQCSDIMSRQDNRRASYFEFLFEQFKFIKKRWWVLAGRNPVSALGSAGRLGRGSKYRADAGGNVGDVFCDDHTGNLEEPAIFGSRD